MEDFKSIFFSEASYNSQFCRNTSPPSPPAYPVPYYLSMPLPLWAVLARVIPGLMLFISLVCFIVQNLKCSRNFSILWKYRVILQLCRNFYSHYKFLHLGCISQLSWHYKISQTEWLHQQKFISYILETGRQRSICRQGWFLQRPVSLGRREPPSLCDLT